MSTLRIITPDDYLETPQGRVFTSERNAAAWRQAYADLETCLAQAVPNTRLYVVMGVQGAGKSTWIRQHAARLDAHALFFDAALPARRHRTPILALAARYQVPCIAVWIDTSLDVAPARNQLHAPDKCVPEASIRSVHAMLEAPGDEEGFIAVIIAREEEGTAL